MKYANSRTAPYAVRQFAPAKGYIFRESFIQHDNIEVLKTGRYDPGKDNVLTAVYGIPGQAWDWVDANEKYYVDRFETDAGQIYAGEFMIATGLGTDSRRCSPPCCCSAPTWWPSASATPGSGRRCR